MNRNSSSKTGLFLMELIIAILFFSLAGAVCIQLFVRSHVISRDSVILNHCILQVQNTAETFYGCNGDLDQMAELLGGFTYTPQEEPILTIMFDEDFNNVTTERMLDTYQSSSDTTYLLHAVLTQEDELLVLDITMGEMNQEPVYSLSVSLFPDKEVSHE
jgi:hypothetical protein